MIEGDEKKERKKEKRLAGDDNTWTALSTRSPADE
jgi:hypothetical protein